MRTYSAARISPDALECARWYSDFLAMIVAGAAVASMRAVAGVPYCIRGGRMFPKTGRKLPRDRAMSSSADYAERIGTALRHEIASGGGGIKLVMGWTGASDRSVRSWLQGVGGPSGIHLIHLARESDAVLEAVLQLAERPELVLGVDLHAAEVALAKAAGALELLKRPRLTYATRT
jgi:hypothetical protein